MNSVAVKNYLKLFTKVLLLLGLFRIIKICITIYLSIKFYTYPAISNRAS